MTTFLVGTAATLAPPIADAPTFHSSRFAATIIPTRHPRFAYVGSRTSRERNGHGKGLTVARIDPQTGEWSEIQVLDDLVNPSFLCFGPERKPAT
jgi:hypothetical protein